MPRLTFALPTFKYHPEPFKTGAFEWSDTVCRACGLARCYVYTGPVHSPDDLSGEICPWCIADGTAHERFGASFTEEDGIGLRSGWHAWDSVPPSVVDEVAHRTPGICTWQSERWWTHCGDAGAFIGYAGAEELTGIWSAAVPAIRRNAGLGPDKDDDWGFILRALDPDGRVVAYVFRCLHCGALGGYWDCD
jgi:hypothetical protein